MERKDILELRRRFTIDKNTFSRLSSCYVNSEKKIIAKFNEFFLNLEEDETHKYLDIAKKVLSGNIGNNILKLDFPLDENFTNKRQDSLINLKKSGLKDQYILDNFFNSIISNYDYDGNFLILVFHDAYDIISKTKDKQSLDDSTDVFEYILCAICPVSLTDPGLIYSEPENKIKSRIRDWVVGAPSNGFVFPAFANRSSDINSLIYYTRRPKNPHIELMEDILGCKARYTTILEKENFQSVVKSSLDMRDEEADTIFMDIQDNLSIMVDEYKSMYDDKDYEPIRLSEDKIKEVLIESNIPKKTSSKIESKYLETFQDELPLVEGLLDKKILKKSQQVQKERNLIKQVGILEDRLEEVLPNNIDNKVILNINPDRENNIRTKTIDEQKYLLVPIHENDETIINGKKSKGI